MPSRRIFPADKLHDWYHKAKRTLPWRSDPLPYKVWVSEIMLQQTQVQTVIPYFERFVKRFPDFKALARAPEQDVLSLWSGLGYYSRARNMHKAAAVVADQYGGRMPSDPDEIRKLPGIGPYTAGAILSIAYDLAIPIMDGNVRRVLGRFFTEPDDKEIWKKSESIVRAAKEEGIRPSHLNQALMELGALVCLPKNPSCLLCPLSAECRARKEGAQDRFPPAGKKPETVSKYFTMILLRRRGKSNELLIRRRPAAERWFKNMWEFPMEESKAQPSPEALMKKLERELKSPIGSPRNRGKFSHAITHHRLEVTVFEAEARPKAEIADAETYRWIAARDLPSVSTSSMLRKALALAG